MAEMKAKENSNRRTERLSLLSRLVVVAFIVATGCGEDEQTQERDAVDMMSTSRVGELCQITSDCKDGLACLGDQQICVVLCEVGSEQCGEGIACQPAGMVGFCPPPAVPEG
mgnify:CR=1 FL=1